MPAYYNENKPEAAHMLKQLIRDGLIAPGDVDERSIVDVRADDLRGYEQCHFFAGIGGWSVALRLAGWDDARPIWTGSCPCQGYSNAGKKEGAGDARNLWPYWSRLIAESKPAKILGEQVERAIAYGWLDEVAHDLEAYGYAFAAAVLPACSVGRPHKRDRIWFVADTGLRDDGGASGRHESQGEKERLQERHEAGQFGESGSPLGNAHLTGSQGRELHAERAGELPAGEDGLEWVACSDGKARPVKPGICLLADGIQHRTPILHAFGNAIVPQAAAEFIKATM